MKKPVIYFGVIILIIIIGLVGFFAYQKTKDKEANNNPAVATSSEQGNVQGENVANYFSEDAKVMYFYSEYCHWCQEEKKVLIDIAGQGYKVKPMDVQKNPEFWEKYSISGTPTFIAPDGTKKVGYLSKEVLQKFLDQYK